MGRNYRDETRKPYQDPGDKDFTLEQLRTGSLLRIADAVEKMAANYTALQNERDRGLRWYEEERDANAVLRRRIVSLRGHITRLKRLSERED
jgi:hypothetical protein